MLRAWLCGVAVVWVLSALPGCAPALPGPADLAVFHEAGPIRPVVDVEKLTRAGLTTGPYRVVVDDLLELHMPVVMRDVIANADARTEPVLCRVGKEGTIRLPVAGEIKVAGATLTEIESAAIAAYYPDYLRRAPAITARVSEYASSRVSVVGVVDEPGIYELRSDEMSVVAALMKAGGIAPEGAGAIWIRRANAPEGSEPLLLPIKGLNIPFTDVTLQGGDTIEVAGLTQHTFTVVGLANRPGVFPYPPGSQMTLAHALASAGGLDVIAAPKYAKICRQDATGKVLVVAFRVGGTDLVDAASIPIKPGDVVAIEQDAATDTRLILLLLLRVGLGLNAGLSL